MHYIITKNNIEYMNCKHKMFNQYLSFVSLGYYYSYEGMYAADGWFLRHKYEALHSGMQWF